MNILEEVIFVVNVQDFVYQKSLVEIAYAGKSARVAYEKFQMAVTCDDGHHRITLDVVEGAFSRRLETHDQVSK